MSSGGNEEQTMAEAVTNTGWDVQAVRRDFPILQQTLETGRKLTYLDNAASAQKPEAVLAKVDEVYRQYFANAYRGVYDFGARVDTELEGSRETLGRFINASSSDEIIFTSGATMSINLVANAWGRKFLQPGDEIIVNLMEHHANLVPWQYIAQQTGAVLRYWPLTADGRLDLSQADQVFSEKTKLLAVTAMSNVLGTINPIGELAKLAHDHGALIAVDGAQSTPHQVVDVQDLSIDFLSFSGHKLFGPTGVGVLYGRRELLVEMDPFLCGGHMIDQVFTDHATWAPPPAKFEAGTHAIAQAIALGTAVEYIQELGFDAIHQHETSLLKYAHETMGEVPGMRIAGPDVPYKGPIVAFTIDGAHAEDLAQLLNVKGVFVRHGHHCTMPLHNWLNVPATVRASFAMYNTREEVDTLVDALHYARKRLRL